VFKEWARSWARRMIIQNAIVLVRPEPTRLTASALASHNGAARAVTKQPEIGAVIALPTFERFVFVISVLEGYSAKNCSLLLASTRADVIAARTRALRSLGISAELRQKSVQAQHLEADRELRDQRKAFSPIAVSA
jgi:hypothetical protein